MPIATPGKSSYVTDPNFIPDVLIVGAGIMGISLAWAAASLGLRTSLLAPDEQPASAAALALIRLAWAGSPQERLWTQEALDEYERRGLLVASGGLWRNAGKERLDKDWHAVDPVRALASVPRIPGRIADAGPYRVRLEDGREMRAKRAVLLCLGADTLPALTFPEGKITWGATAILPPAGRGLTVTQIRPYHVIGDVSSPAGRRLGSSTGTTGEHILQRLGEDAAKIGVDLSGQPFLAGRRFASETKYRNLAPGLWWCGGLGRLGYALAPGLAKRILREV